MPKSIVLLGSRLKKKDVFFSLSIAPSLTIVVVIIMIVEVVVVVIIVIVVVVIIVVLSSGAFREKLIFLGGLGARSPGGMHPQENFEKYVF